MQIHIISPDETTPVDLPDGTFTLGGGETDDIRLEGLPVKLLTLSIDGPRLSLKAIRPLRVGEQLFPANVVRLVLPGEAFSLPNDVQVRRPDDEAARERRKNISTDFLARELLKGEAEHYEMRAASLTCVAGEDEGHVFPLAFVDTVLGRGDDVDVRLRDRTVSRRHATLIRRREGYLVQVLATTNGVYVNGKVVERSRRVRSGDVIELGHSMLRFEEGEKAPEECTVIQKAVETPKPAEVTPAAVEAEPPSVVTQPTARSSRTTDLAIAVIGVLLVLSGLGTALAFAL